VTARISAAVVGASLSIAAMAEPPPCKPAQGRHVASVSGEVAGEHAFSQTVGPGWTLRLERATAGWELRLLADDGIDLTAVTPPYHGTNPRQLYGWHFRNADNSGPNRGEINAPQQLRLFLFSPGLAGTGGFKPPQTEPSSVDADGRGWLYLDEMGLTDLEPGERARMVYLRFRSCLSWPKSAAEIAEEETLANPTYIAEEIETFASCGLAEPYQLRAYVLPRIQLGDLDGDGALDSVATAVRTTDDSRGLAICRSGSRLDLLGFDEPLDELEPEYFDRVERWVVQPRSKIIAYQGAPPLRRFDHDVITVERLEKSSYTIYWEEDRFRARRDYRMVEP